VDKNFHTWRKAYAVRGIGFTKAEQDAGWPDDMRIGQVARLQCPGDVPKERKIYGWLLADCTSGELPNIKTSRITKRPWSKKMPVTFASVHWDGVPGKTVIVHGVTDDVVDTYRVTAPALKTWLELIGEPPSEHIAAWFDAVGAGAAQAEPVTEGDSAPTAETIDDRNLRWLNRYETEEHTAKRGAYNRTAAHFGVESSTLRKAVNKARQERTARNRDGIKAVPKKRTASMFDGLSTTVKDGKKTTNNQR